MSAGAEGAVAGETAEQQQQQQHVDAREVLLAQEGSIAAAVAGEMAAHIEYSEKYMDDRFEYRHVILPKKLAEKLPSTRLLRENEWRGIGVQQSRGWSHYAIHK
jgi:cyclin-dependent kinase regulatory subunit CKS1